MDKIVGIFLAFMLGVFLTWTGVFPFDPWLRNGVLGLQAGLVTLHRELFGYNGDVWRTLPEDSEIALGVTKLDEDAVSPGLTLITAGQTAYLIGHDGEARHSWSVDYQSLPRDAAGNAPGSADDDMRLYFQRAHALPNGDLLAIVNQTQSSPDGLAMIRLDRDSNPVWVAHGPFHHDFDVDESGNVFVLDQLVRQAPPKNIPRATGPLLDDGIAVIGPDGTLVHRVSIIDAFSNSPYAEMINRHVAVNKISWGDYLHANNVDVASEAIARRFDFLEPGQVLLSMREVDVIAVLDMTEETIVWAMRGSWSRQHDPDFLPNGNLLIYDNRGDWNFGGKTRVIEVDPQTQEIVWQYPKASDEAVWSVIRGESEVLPNGNVLLNEFSQNRLLEVTRAGEIAWEYRCPYRHARESTHICQTMSARRYARSDFDFAFSNPGNALETNTQFSHHIEEVTR